MCSSHIDSLGIQEPRYNEVPNDRENEFVISGFFSIHFTITGLKNIVRYTGVFATSGSFSIILLLLS